MARSIARQPRRLGIILSVLPVIIIGLFSLQSFLSRGGDSQDLGQQDVISASSGSPAVNNPSAGTPAGHSPASTTSNDSGANTDAPGNGENPGLDPGYVAFLSVDLPASSVQTGSPPPGIPGIPDPQPTGMLYGNVWQDEIMDGSVGNITIFLADSNGTFMGKNVLSDQQGSFSFPVLSPGLYKLYIFDSYNIYQSGWYGGDINPQGTAIKVPSGGQTFVSYRLRAQKSSYGSISGQVTGSGQGVPKTDVFAYMSDKSGKNMYLVEKVTSDENGFYRFDRLTATSQSDGQSGSNMGYKIYFVPPGASGYAPQWYAGQSSSSGAKLIDLGVGETVSGIDATLGSGGTISGSVSIDGKPAPFATVEFFDLSGVAVGFVKTDAEGLYVSAALAPAVYKVHAQAAGMQVDKWYDNQKSFSSASPVTVQENQDTGGINITMEGGRPPDVILLGQPQQQPGSEPGRGAAADVYEQPAALPGGSGSAQQNSGIPENEGTTRGAGGGPPSGGSTSAPAGDSANGGSAAAGSAPGNSASGSSAAGEAKASSSGNGSAVDSNSAGK